LEKLLLGNNLDQLILASASETRRKLLENAGVIPEIITASIDETEIKQSLVSTGATPPHIAETLAEHKATTVSRKNLGRIVVGADQILAFRGRVYSKPATKNIGRDQLLSLRGETHQLFSSACVAISGERVWHYTGEANMTVRHFSQGFIEDYLAKTGEKVLLSPGGYQLEGLGVQLFERVEGDYFTILGLPLLPLLQFLRDRGVLA
jgi:septum formation protein